MRRSFIGGAAVLAIVVGSAGGATQVNCDAMPPGPARTDCYIGLARIYRQQRDAAIYRRLNVFESEHFRLPRRSMKVLRETEVSLAFDGGNNVGMLALFHAAQATIKKTAVHDTLVSVTDAWMSGRGALCVPKTSSVLF